MPNFADIKAGGAFIELYTKNSKFYKGLRAASHRLTKWGQGATAIGARLMGAGAAIAGPFVAASKVFASMGDNLDKMAARTGVGVESLSELGFAANQSGASVNALEGLLAKMNRRFGRVTAGAGSSSQVSAIEELGLSVDELAKKDAEGRFLAIADAMAKYGDQAAAAGLAQRIFGTNVDAVLPLIMQGAEGIEALRQKARDWGLVISPEDTAQAAAFTDQMDVLSKVFKMAVFSGGAAVAPMLGEWVIKVAKVIRTVTSWVKENQGLVVSVFKIGAAVAAAGAALVGIGTALGLAGAAVGGVATLMTTFASVVSGAIGVLGFFLSPIGLVLVALAGLAGYLIYTSGVLGWLKERFGELAGFAIEAFGAIKDALAGGDFKLAGQIIWTALKVQWTKGVNWLMDKWYSFRDFFSLVWTEAVYGLSSKFLNIIPTMQKAWWTFIKSFQDMWKGAEKTLAHGIAWAIAKIQGLDPADVAKALDEDYGRKQKGQDDKFQKRMDAIQSEQDAANETLQADRQRAVDEKLARQEAAAAKRVAAAEAAEAKAQASYDALRHEARELAESAPERAKDEAPTVPTPEGPAPAIAAGQSSLAQTATVFSKEFYTAIVGRDREDQAQTVRERQLDAQLEMAGKMASIDTRISGVKVAPYKKGG